MVVMVDGYHTKKMTFRVPDQMGQKFRNAIPPGKRSALITGFMANASRNKGAGSNQGLQNTLGTLSRNEMDNISEASRYVLDL